MTKIRKIPDFIRIVMEVEGIPGKLYYLLDTRTQEITRIKNGNEEEKERGDLESSNSGS